MKLLVKSIKNFLPSMQRQVNFPRSSRQVPSLRQGLEWHSLMFVSQRGPSKPGWQSQRNDPGVFTQEPPCSQGDRGPESNMAGISKPCEAEFFFWKTEAYIWTIFLKIKLAQVVEIPFHGKQGLIQPAQSISGLLMTWRHRSQGISSHGSDHAISFNNKSYQWLGASLW